MSQGQRQQQQHCVPRVGVPEHQAMPAPPASSWNWAETSRRGWAAREGEREQIKLGKALSEVQQKSSPQGTVTAQRRGDPGSASLSLISRQG